MIDYNNNKIKYFLIASINTKIINYFDIKLKHLYCNKNDLLDLNEQFLRLNHSSTIYLITSSYNL